MPTTAKTDGRRQYTPATMLRAREHFDAGWKPTQIRRLLEREGHGSPCVNTIYQWVNPGYRERHIESMRLRKARMSASGASFRLSSSTPEYMLAFMLRLRQEQLSCEAIAKVMRVTLGTSLTEHQVRYRLAKEGVLG